MFSVIITYFLGCLALLIKMRKRHWRLTHLSKENHRGHRVSGAFPDVRQTKFLKNCIVCFLLSSLVYFFETKQILIGSTIV